MALAHSCFLQSVHCVFLLAPFALHYRTALELSVIRILWAPHYLCCLESSSAKETSTFLFNSSSCKFLGQGLKTARLFAKIPGVWPLDHLPIETLLPLQLLRLGLHSSIFDFQSGLQVLNPVKNIPEKKAGWRDSWEMQTYWKLSRNNSCLFPLHAGVCNAPQWENLLRVKALRTQGANVCFKIQSINTWKLKIIQLWAIIKTLLSVNQPCII